MPSDDRELVQVTRTWTYTTEVPAEYVEDGTIEDVFMEAFTQGDGRVSDQVVPAS